MYIVYGLRFLIVEILIFFTNKSFLQFVKNG